MTATTPTTPTTSTAARELRARCGDHVHLPGSDGYDQHRMPWNVSVEQRPAAVAVPTTPDEVVVIVRTAAELGLRVSAQSTGHASAPLAAHGLVDTVLLRTGALADVRVDALRRTARVEAGARWGDVVAAAAPHGLTALHGSAPHVGVVGYTLGGGLGWYARCHGLAAHGLRRAEVVTAAGELVTADRRSDPELLWALRGGGGSFGVVTAVEIELHDVGRPYAGMMLWDIAHAERVLRAWAAWCETAPESVTTSFRVMRFPTMPELPPFLSGRAVVLLDGAVIGTEDEARPLLAPLRALTPEMDTFATVDPPDVTTIHGDPVDPTPAVGAGTVLRELSADAIDAYLAAAGPEVETQVFIAELRQAGGALSRPGDAALSHVEGSHVGMFLALAPTSEMHMAGGRATQELADALAPWSTGSAFLNLTDRPVEPSRAFTAEAWTRLLAVRRRVDPHGMFVAGHRITD
jgi:FAD/FMN-containing dehydrogenase